MGNGRFHDGDGHPHDGNGRPRGDEGIVAVAWRCELEKLTERNGRSSPHSPFITAR